MPSHALLADIGGTNTRVALADRGILVPGSIRHYRNADFESLEPVLRRYLAETETGRPDAACLAMAGPVREGRGTLTNLDWALDTEVLAAATGARTVALLNDLQAQGHALGHLPSSALQTVIPGPPPHLSAAQLVIGVGTGFNAAPVFNTRAGRYVPPSEAGHAGMPVRDDDARRLAAFVAERHGFAAVEEVLSGRGLATIHDWLALQAGAPTGATSQTVMADLQRGTPLAIDAVRWFVRLLGHVAGDLALTLLPFGGVFLVGGMARAVAPYLAHSGFVEGFRDKGRFASFMDQFAVTVISDDDAALIGSAKHLEAQRTLR